MVCGIYSSFHICPSDSVEYIWNVIYRGAAQWCATSGVFSLQLFFLDSVCIRHRRRWFFFCSLHSNVFEKFIPRRDLFCLLFVYFLNNISHIYNDERYSTLFVHISLAQQLHIHIFYVEIAREPQFGTICCDSERHAKQANEKKEEGKKSAAKCICMLNALRHNDDTRQI